MVKIAEAYYSENPSDRKWGVPGDQLQTTPESYDGELRVSVLNNDDYKFTKCFRWKNEATGREAADFTVRICQNVKVGYSQYNAAAPRDSLLKELRNCHWAPEDIKNKCNCDCASLMMTVMRKFDLEIPEDMWTGSQCAAMRATGAFVEYDIKDGFLYHKGDILWRTGHTAIVCEAPEPAADMHTAPDIKAVNIRKAPVNGTIIKAVGANVGVKLLAENPWYYVELEDGTQGWMSGKYLV